MATFIESYVRKPLDDLLNTIPDELPEITLGMTDSSFSVTIGNEAFRIERLVGGTSDDEIPLPEDVDDQMPGA